MVEIEKILDFSQCIVREFRPEYIILFGSYAYGTPTNDSDVDLLVVLPFKGKPSYKAVEILKKTCPKIPVDLLVRTPEQVKERVASGDWFLSEVLEKGRKLYESEHSRMGG
ncbi:MAG: nucleotidyltransferase domain-containing protein [Acidobacteria bacterium]|nr:nucleotidyltransferase domain-containing protein [Acidobacteriota bacterium]